MQHNFFIKLIRLLYRQMVTLVNVFRDIIEITTRDMLEITPPCSAPPMVLMKVHRYIYSCTHLLLI